MNFVESVWYLNKYCPCCEQGDSLTYVKCTRCQTPILVCDETKSIFPEGLNGSSKLGFKDVCHICGSEVRAVTGEEMQEIGYSVDEYQ